MSGGLCCKCEESKKPLAERAWEVTQYKCNHSAFGGYHKADSDWSALSCHHCRAQWRSKGRYVDALYLRGSRPDDD